MPSFIYLELLAHGKYCLMASRHIQQFIITSDVGILRGLWEQINSVLREQVRMKQGKSHQATAAIVDSQSVKTTEKKGKYTASMVAS